MVQSLLPFTQLLLSVCNLIILAYAFRKFLGKPQEDLESRVGTLEYEVKDIRHSLMQGNDRFRTQDEMNEVLIRTTLALIEFEVHYCETEQKPLSKNLEKAKDDLHEYFARNRRI
jgi:hypothetical protein